MLLLQIACLNSDYNYECTLHHNDAAVIVTAIFKAIQTTDCIKTFNT